MTKAELEQALDDALKVIDELKAQKNITVNLSREEFEGVPKRIRLRSLCHCPLNVSDKKNCEGETFSFREFGEETFVRPDWLIKAVREYPNTFKCGVLALVDVDELTRQWLADEYLLDSIVIDGLSPETIENTINTVDIDTMLKLSDYMQEDMMMQIVNRVANNQIDLNNPEILRNIRRVKQELEIDIMEQAEYLQK